MNVRYDMVTVFVIRPGAGEGAGAGAGEHELLQLRRCAQDYLGGAWSLVRGTAEGNETAPQAALRELREETALAPRAFYGLSSIDSFYTEKFETIWHCPVFVALVDRAAAVRLNEEHDAFRWIPLTQVRDLLMWQRERELLAEIQRELLCAGLARDHLLIPT